MGASLEKPSGLFGLLKESFAGGAAIARAATDPNTDSLIKAVVPTSKRVTAGSRLTTA
jgi:hypothetical protein